MLSATSSFSYPASAAKMTSCFAERYSTVGQRDPICRRRRLLKICTTSLRASNSNRATFWTRRKRRSVLYVSCASCAMSSGAGSTEGNTILIECKPRHSRSCYTPPSPYRIALICWRFFVTSSLAWTTTLRQRSPPCISSAIIAKSAPHTDLSPRLSPWCARLQPRYSVPQSPYEIRWRPWLCLEEIHSSGDR